MRAAVLEAPFRIAVHELPDPRIQGPDDAIVRVVLTCVCGSDLWDYRGIHEAAADSPMGHEFLGVIEEIGSGVTGLRVGQLVVSPFKFSDNTCDTCVAGFPCSCPQGGGYGWNGVDGGQGEYVRVPLASGTLVPVPVGERDPLLPALLTLSDVMGTGHHAARCAGVVPGATVAVIGDGAVGLCGVLAARRLGAERIILLGSHPDRIARGREYGATDVVTARGEDALVHVHELTRGSGVPHVLECVGTAQSWRTATGIAAVGGTIGYVGVPENEALGVPLGSIFGANISVRGGLAPVRAYLPELAEDVLDGRLDPSGIFDLEVSLDDIATGYRRMHERTAIKAIVRP